jgi:hypothetical protein
MSRYGLIPSFMFLAAGEYKQEILFFDSLTAHQGALDQALTLLGREEVADELRDSFEQTIRILTDNGLLTLYDSAQIDSEFKTGLTGLTQCARGRVVELTKARESLAQFEPNEWTIWESTACTATLHSVVLQGVGFGEVYPILFDRVSFDSQLDDQHRNRKANLAVAILRQFPSIDPATPWEALVDFKLDPESRLKYLALRDWITEQAYSEKTLNESIEKLEHLLHTYESHLSSHRLKYKVGTLRVVLTYAASIAENALKLKLAKLTETVFDWLQGSAEFMRDNRDLPGKEVAYISEVKVQFGESA